jgi:23S rRNA (uracil1939-C5)-methyltransferase
LTSKDIPRSGAAALRVGAEIEVAFTDLLTNGQAVGRASGLVIFCFGPLPQERARVRIVQIKPKYAVGEMVSLLSGSANRATPFCSVFGACGGCQLQHLAYPAQLTWKADAVRSALERIGGFTGVAVRKTVGMTNPRSYRNKMSLVVDRTRGTPAIGFYQQRTHDIVPIDACPVVTPQLNDYIGRLSAARYRPETREIFDAAQHIVSRNARATGEAVVTITTAQASPEVEQGAANLLRLLPGAVGLTNSYDLQSQNAIMGRRHKTVVGRAEIEESIAGVRYRVSAGSFFQVNTEIVGRIFDVMRSGLAQPRRIVDLYCGAGTFALFFAQLGSTVYGIEENSQAILEAETNAKINRLSDWVRFRAGRVEDIVQMSEARDALASADIVFLDPPRKGSDEITLSAIAKSGAAYVWYLSCDPATLARDLKFLAANGYRLGVVQPFDMFPQTGHIETLVTLYHEDRHGVAQVEEAFLDVPPPAWPDDDELSTDPREYPDFVIRED